MRPVFFVQHFCRIFHRSVCPCSTPDRLVSRRFQSSMSGWVLECLQRLHDPIPLPDKTPVRLGRSPQTQITDPRCSRLQVEVQVSWKTSEIKVTQLGSNTSAVDGRELERGKTVKVKPGSTLFILKGEFPHRVILLDSSETKSSDKEIKKSSSSSSDRSSTSSSKRGVKRSADKTNGRENEEISSAKKHKHSENEAAGVESKKKSKEKNPSEVTDFFKKDNKDNHRDRKKKDGEQKDREPSSEKKKKEHSSSKRDSQSNAANSHGKVDKNSSSSKNDSQSNAANSHGKVDKNTPSSKNEKKRRVILDSSEDEDEAHMRLVAEKLQKMKKKAKLERTSDGDHVGDTSVSKSTADSGSVSSSEKKKSAANSTADSGSVSSSEKKKSASNSSSKKKVRRGATWVEEAAWASSEDEKLYIYNGEGVLASEKIAGFDIDGTIITTQSGRVFPKDMGDWKILMPEVFGKLKHLIAADYKIVFFTNQLGVGRGKVKIADLQAKFEKVVSKLQIPVQIFISTSGGSFRKPSLGMWQTLKKHWNEGIPITMADSFYVGDAAGREANWAPKKKKDFSCSDRLFAINAGLRFHTPEEFFLGHKAAASKLPDFDPRAMSKDTPLLEGGEDLTSIEQEVVVMVGFQASGKSTFAQTHLVPKDYFYVNQDTMRTWQKCVSECAKALTAGKSVVIDNTNVDAETRLRYIECARKAGVPCRCLFFDFPISHCRHNERFREITNKDHKPINEQIFNMTKSKFKAPEAKEGFSKIVKVNFVPLFENKIHEKIYRQFLLEK